MKNPTTFYKNQLDKHRIHTKSLYKQMTTLSSLRLLVFIGISCLIYFNYTHWELAVLFFVIGIIVFIYLLSKYTDIKSKRALHNALININEEELKIGSGDYYHRDQGLQFQSPQHYYSLDIDLFGRGSFFQYLNRTSIPEGSKKLAKALKANTIEHIPQRQNAIRELADNPEWRQEFSAKAQLIKVETPALKIVDWLKNHHSFLPSYIRWLPLAFSLLSLLLLGLSIMKIIDVSLLGYWLLIGLGLTGRYLKSINALSVNTEKVKDTFRQYALLLNQIEIKNFQSELLLEKQVLIKSEHKKASEIFSELSKHLDALDNRNNLIAAIFGNGLLLSDIKNSFNVERWIAKYAHKVEDWFEVISFFDAYNSFGNYAFNHDTYVFPQITNASYVLEAKSLGHPLLDKTQRIDSDININNREFFIVTGANMAGKSTFLRTVSLHIVMANVGLPVCAKSSKYSPVKLITSMRTSDSLTDDSSYFFSELTRLKFIVDAIQNDSYFIVLDEILKGTNSTDKAIGSKKFVEKLVASNATGIIATHDLSLCDIENKLPEVKNYFFDANIINDELHFDYTFKKGICQNMNASFLLKKMNIV